MKKNNLIIGLIIMILISASCNNKKEKVDKIKNDVVQLEMKGIIKSLVETKYEAIEKFGEEVEGEVINYNSYFFNKNGYITQDSAYTKYNDGNLKCKSNYIYNITGILIEKNVASIEAMSNKINNGLSGKYLYVYDDKGKLIEENKYNSDSSFQCKVKFKYDYKGYIIEKAVYNMIGNLESKDTYKYDDEGNKIEENMFFGKRKIATVFNKYNENNQLLEFTEPGGGISKYEYDDNGYEIGITETGTESREFKSKYKFDANNNWTQKICYLNNVPSYIVAREIKYY